MRMSKTFKRIGAAVVTMAIALSVAVLPAAATDTKTDTLPAEKGTLTIHKYLGAETTAPDGEELETAPTGDLLNGVTFDLYQLFYPDAETPTQTSTNAVGVATDQGEDAYPVAPITVVYDDGVPSTITDAKGNTFFLGAKQSKVTAAGIAEFADLNGIYVAIENVNDGVNDTKQDGTDAKVTSPCSPFIVSVPMTKEDTTDGNTKWITDVHVYPKNQSNLPTKTVEEPATAVGDELHYTIYAKIPSNLASLGRWGVQDILDSQLDLVADSVKFYAMKGTLPDGTAVAGDLSTDANAVSVSNKFTDDSTNLPTGAEGFKYLLTQGTEDLTTDPITRVYTDIAKEWADAGYTYIAVQFSAKVNDTFTGTVANTPVSFTNTNKDGGDPDTDPDTPAPGTPKFVHTGVIHITKQDASDATVFLAGAEFKIATSEANAKAGIFLQGTDNAIYAKADTDAEALEYGYTVKSSTDYTVTTGTDGKIQFVGLIDSYNDDGTLTPATYYLVETKAPAGYNLVGTPIEFTFAQAQIDAWETQAKAVYAAAYKASYDAAEKDTPKKNVDAINAAIQAGEAAVKEAMHFYVNGDDKATDKDDEALAPASGTPDVETVVKNSKGFILPLTGGNGSILLVVGGIVLLGMAALLVVMPKKKKNVR